MTSILRLSLLVMCLAIMCVASKAHENRRERVKEARTKPHARQKQKAAKLSRNKARKTARYNINDDNY